MIAGTASLTTYLLVVRPYFLRWGTTDAEVKRTLLGDELVPNPKTGYTQAITINVPPEKVWPWIVQIGYQRGGWYTYDWFYQLTKSGNFVDGHSANRIISELQMVKVGDIIRIHAEGPYTIAHLEPNRAMVLQAKDDVAPMNISWAFILEPLGSHVTRLVVRNRTDYGSDPGMGLFLTAFTDGGALIMQPKMLKGIKQRSETL